MTLARCLPLLILPVVMAQQQQSTRITDNRSPFLPVQPARADVVRFRGVLPDFDGHDTTGRRWRSQDLRGKFTLIYVWYTFESEISDAIDQHARQSIKGLPDLPEIQRFYDKAGTADNAQVLTFCGDDLQKTQEYLKKTNYTFPVISDSDLIGKLFPTAARLWVVNPEGKLSDPFPTPNLGFILFQIEKATQIK